MITPALSGSLFVVAAPSGAGKSTLVNALLKLEPGIKLSISTTTRPPRPGEQDGREYHFTSAEDFVSRADRGEFMEWAEVHGNYYGTSRLTVEQEMKNGTDILLEIDWQGARQVKKQFPDAAGIFILPPSIEALEERLHKRGTDEPHIITRRLLAAGGRSLTLRSSNMLSSTKSSTSPSGNCRRSSKRHVAVSPSRRPATPTCLPNWESTRINQRKSAAP